MANRLLTPADWEDQGGEQPPSEWNGSAYVYSYGDEEEAQFALKFMGTAVVDDVFAGEVAFANFDGLAGFLNHVSGATIHASVPVSSGGSASFSFEAIDASDIILAAAANSFNPATYYGLQVTATPSEAPEVCNFNCECEDEYPTRTLAQMREFMMIRLGWAAMKDTPLPGVNDTLNAFLQDAQDQLHAEYRLPRLERFFTWDLLDGVRFYDLIDNADVCTKELDPRQLTWIGISDGCDVWRKLVCGIPPESYYDGISGVPTRYEIRQCIEVWPPPGGDIWKLRIKGYFYNESLSEDDDVASLDYQAVQLFALANAKAHYGQQDASNVMRQAMRYIGNMTAGAHHTRRYVPGTKEWIAPPLPVLTGYPGDP